jgi:hypothetical protein
MGCVHPTSLLNVKSVSQAESQDALHVLRATLARAERAKARFSYLNDYANGLVTRGVDAQRILNELIEGDAYLTQVQAARSGLRAIEDQLASTKREMNEAASRHQALSIEANRLRAALYHSL